MKTESQFRSTVSLKRSKIAFSLLYRESNTPKKIRLRRAVGINVGGIDDISNRGRTGAR